MKNLKTKPFIFWAAVLWVLNIPFTYADETERAKQIIDYTADVYTPPPMTIGDPEKYCYPVAMARFEKYGINDPKANEYIEVLSRRAVFHFATVGLVRLIFQYPDAPAIKNRFSEIVARQIRGNLWTSEGTENHLNMERTSGFLVAQTALELFPERKGELQKKYDMMRDWILRWSERLLLYGEGEWNSSIYQTYSIISWLNVVDFAKDPVVREAAKKVVDFYTYEMAFHYSWGTTGGAEMRGNGAMPVNRNATNYLCWLWFGGDTYGEIGMDGSQVIQVMHAIVSGYQPSEETIALARKEQGQTDWYDHSRPSYLYEDVCYVKKFFCIGDGYTLGSCVSEYGGYTGASSQIIPWRLVVRRKDNLPWEIGGNGSYYREWSGKWRSPYTQYMQYRNVLIQLTKVPQNVELLTDEIYSIVDHWKLLWKADYEKRFGSTRHVVVSATSKDRLYFENESFINLPQLPYTFSDNLLIADAGEVFIAVRFLRTAQVFDAGKAFENRLIFTDKAPRGLVSGYVLEVVSKKDCSDSKTFRQELLKKSIKIEGDTLIFTSFSGNRFRASYNPIGTFTEGLYDWGYGTVEQQSFITAPPFRQPDWPNKENLGKIPILQVDDRLVDYKKICNPNPKKIDF